VAKDANEPTTGRLRIENLGSNNGLLVASSTVTFIRFLREVLRAHKEDVVGLGYTSFHKLRNVVAQLDFPLIEPSIDALGPKVRRESPNPRSVARAIPRVANENCRHQSAPLLYHFVIALWKAKRQNMARVKY